MAEAVICTPVFETFFSGTILPLVGYAAIVTSAMIAAAFMVGRTLANAKLTLWAKTEALQILISVATVFFLLITINTFCAINMGEVASFFTGVEAPEDLSLYDAAQEYLREAALYSHNAMTVVRYHLEAYTVLSFLNAFMCDIPIGPIGLGCFFGYSGNTELPIGGYGAYNAALNIFFNSTIMAHFSALNFLFILLFVYKGFVFLFLPLGVFLRSMPYLRSFGSLLVSVALAFLLVYPFMLSIFYLMGGVLVDRDNNYRPDVGGTSLNRYYNEEKFPDWETGGALLQSLTGATFGSEIAEKTYFSDGDNPGGAIMFAAYAFIAAVFMPTAALIATIASVSYIARLYGEEIDLRRITQMV